MHHSLTNNVFNLLNTGHLIKSFLKINCIRVKGVRMYSTQTRPRNSIEVNRSIQWYLTCKTDKVKAEKMLATTTAQLLLALPR
jgi:hypothetical protein